MQLLDLDLAKLKIDFEIAKNRVYQNLDIKRMSMTLDDWHDEWFTNYKAPQLKESSVFSTKRRYKNTFGRILGRDDIITIQNIDIQKAINELKGEGKANSTVRSALGEIRECLESAKNNQLIKINPCFDIKVPWQSTQKEWRFLSEDEQKRFLEATENNWYHEMFCIMLLTGMRVGEVGGLQWEDVDFKNKCIYINHSLSCNYEDGVKILRMNDPKTFNSKRRIPFIGEAEKMFLLQREKQTRLKKKIGKRWRANSEYDYVFTNTLGGECIRHLVEKEINKIVKDINQNEVFTAKYEDREPVFMEPVFPHALRHTFCSNCFRDGIKIKAMQALMGHQHYSTTLDIYTHITGEQIDEETVVLKGLYPFKTSEEAQEDNVDQNDEEQIQAVDVNLKKDMTSCDNLIWVKMQIPKNALENMKK